MIGANEKDTKCDKCAELDKLRNTLLRYEKSLCALLNIAYEATQDRMIDIITDTLKGFDLMEQYENDVLEGKNRVLKSKE